MSNGRHIHPIPDPAVHPLKYRLLQLRWRIALATVVYPVQLALAVALAVCAIPVYLLLEAQAQLHDAQRGTDALARANQQAIKDLRALTIRVTTIEKPTAAQLREGIARALHRCAQDPRCREAFVRFNVRVQRRAARPGGAATAPSAPRGTTRRGGGSGGRGAPGHAPTTTVPRPPDHPTTPPRAPPPNSGGSGGGTPPRPPPHPWVHIVPPPVPGVPSPTVCTPVVGVNCP